MSTNQSETFEGNRDGIRFYRKEEKKRGKEREKKMKKERYG